MIKKEFHNVCTIKEAFERINKNIIIKPKIETIPLCYAHNRILAENIVAQIDIPPFSRSTKDGYAVIASDIYQAEEDKPITLKLNPEKIPAGYNPITEIKLGHCSEIATGSIIPKGANGVVMVEQTNPDKNQIKVYSSISPGENINYSGSDIMMGEVLILKRTKLTARETAIIATQGINTVKVYKNPKIGVISTGNEIVKPGEKIKTGQIYDINSRIICDFIKELNIEPKFYGIVGDDKKQIITKIKQAKDCDLIILSGGTSKGKGDINYNAIQDLGDIFIHGVAIKPGKPIAIGLIKNKPIIILPGFPTSAAITFNVFVAPIINQFFDIDNKLNTNKISLSKNKILAKTKTRLNSSIGKHEFILVNIIKDKNDEYSIYPINKSSGAISAFSYADGFVEIPEQIEAILKNETLKVTLFSDHINIADINFIGSHCVFLEPAVQMLRNRGFATKVMHVGSTLGIGAAEKEECDVCGTHLLSEITNTYNTPFIKHNQELVLIKGYKRMQGIVYKKTDKENTYMKKIDITNIKNIDLKDIDLKDINTENIDTKQPELKDFVLNNNLKLINRNQGSGTRVLFDILLNKIAENQKINITKIQQNISGYDTSANTHNAVACAVAQNKADYGLAIKTVADKYGLDFIPLKFEDYDFCVPKSKLNKNSVQIFIKILKSKEFHEKLMVPGIEIPDNIGDIIWPV